MLKRNQHSGGAALVVALFALLLISIVILAFFDQARMNRRISFSSASQARANIIALSAMDFIKADLIEEIKAGSTSVTFGDSGTGAYEPRAARNMLPYDMVSDLDNTNNSGTIPFNLIKWSSAEQNFPFWKNSSNQSDAASYECDGSAPAVDVSSTAASINGRYIDRIRWNKPFIVSGSLSSAIDPHWVLITRQGPLTDRNTPMSELNDINGTNANYVIGRYAFIVYDTGGLLDINAAGYPTAPSVETDSIARKGTIGYADLSQLGLSEDTINKLITQYRNRATAVSGTRYVDYLREVGGSFRAVAAGDNVFLGRQDFLAVSGNDRINLGDYATKFTTFSREKNAPSWGPTYNAVDHGGRNAVDTSISPPDPDGIRSANAYAYKDERNNDNATNRFLPNLTVTASGTRLVSGGTMQPGEALVQRFDLAKVDWIRFDEDSLPSGFSSKEQLAEAILNNFGLRRVAKNTKHNGIDISGAWQYVGHPGDADYPAPVKIATLKEVADRGREPDFFELLQAVILRGSLGLSTGSYADKTGEFTRLNDTTLFGGNNEVQGSLVQAPVSRLEKLPNGSMGLINTQEKYQIFQIGANIIDQWDADSFPTELRIGNTAFYGVENLPYVISFGNSVLRPAPAGSSPSGATWEAALPANKFLNDYQIFVHNWVNFALWNPHSNAVDAALLPNVPESVRILVAGGRLYTLNHDGSKIETGYYQGRNFSPPDESNPHKPIANYTQYTTYPSGPAWIGFKPRDYNYFSEPTDLINSGYDFAYVGDENNPANANLNAYLNGGSGMRVTEGLGIVRSIHGWRRAGIYLGYWYHNENPYKIPATAPLYGYVTGTKKAVGTPFEARLYNYEDMWTNQGYGGTVPRLNTGGGSVHYTRYSGMLNLNTTSGEFEASGGPMRIHLQYEDPANLGTWHTYQILSSVIIGIEGQGGPYVEVNDPGVWGQTYKYVPVALRDEKNNIIGYRYDALPGDETMRWYRREFPSYYTWADGNNGNAETKYKSYAAVVSAIMGQTGIPGSDGELDTWLSAGLRNDHWDALKRANNKETTVFFTGDPRSTRNNFYFTNNYNGITDSGASFDLSGILANSFYNDDIKLNRITTPGPHFYWDGAWNWTGGRMISHAMRFWLSNTTANDSYYSDRDFVVRPGDYVNSANISPLPPGASSVRPVMLNRRFLSVAELGYVFRDEPWKTLDLFTAKSGDAGLLDVFYIGSGKPATADNGNSQAHAVAGRVNLNSVARDIANSGGDARLLAAIISGGAKDFVSTSGTITVSDTYEPGEARDLAKTIGDKIAATPLQNPGELSGIIETLSFNNTDSALKPRREALLRALTGSIQTRTWNLLIDVIAQAGRYGAGAADSWDLDKFIVEGEKHYWLHVAIDRFTGEVVDQQLEPVLE
ncbi:MAG: hypothetical protein LBK60_01640 [Verrucomicrobiales bacterium]|jgi:Tfp pilus assembly protein PilX|nr:hypothetical protein [Verrucomicrobiales bacterium]